MSLALVTGSTGTVGAEVTRLLVEAGYPVRAAVSGVDRATTVAEGAEPVILDFNRPETYGPALRGVEALFLMRPPAIANTRRYVNPLVDVAREVGVRRVVLLSLLGAEKNPLVSHRAVERHLVSSGLPYTFLRPGYFMQNLSGIHRAEIAEHGQIIVPAGRGKTSFVDARDVAAVVARALTEDGHAFRAYPLTGPEAPDYFRVAEVFSEVLGRRIVYTRPSATEFAAGMRKRGFSWDFVAVTVGIYTAARLGSAGTLTDDLARLLGRPPTTLRRFVEDYRATWGS
jgi:uncharacterized protein YbjT (DUF2867 family)